MKDFYGIALQYYKMWRLISSDYHPIHIDILKSRQQMQMLGLLVEPAKLKIGDVVYVNDSRKPYKGIISEITYTSHGDYGKLAYGIDGVSTWRHYETANADISII